MLKDKKKKFEKMVRTVHGKPYGFLPNENNFLRS